MICHFLFSFSPPPCSFPPRIELVDNIFTSAQEQLLDHVAEQTSLAVRRAADFVLRTTVDRLQNSLTGHAAAANENWRQSMALSAKLASDLALPQASNPVPPPKAAAQRDE